MADYTHLSRPYMLAAKRFGTPVLPILGHAAIHAVLMLIVLLIFSSIWKAVLLSLFILLTHWGIDILKGKMNLWFPKLQDSSNKYHWWVFGLDQLLHTSVILIVAYLA